MTNHDVNKTQTTQEQAAEREFICGGCGRVETCRECTAATRCQFHPVGFERCGSCCDWSGVPAA
jgi:hypothetical protein